MLTDAERNDLRLKVLRGEQLTLEECRDVCASLRHTSTVLALTPEEKKTRKSGSKKPTLSDEQLDAELSSLGL